LPGIPRYTIQDDSYDGYFIPKGCVLHATQFAMFKDEGLYPDADTFNPDRWLNPDYHHTFQGPLAEHPNMKRYAAFGFGRRICPGLEAGERSLFIQVSTLSRACSVVTKLDAEGNPIAVPWYPVKPKGTTELGGVEFGLEFRDPKRREILRQRV
jgi:cytochrome P450